MIIRRRNAASRSVPCSSCCSCRRSIRPSSPLPCRASSPNCAGSIASPGWARPICSPPPSIVPIYGKLGDIYGRRPVLVFGVLMFLAGSMLCGLAGEFGALPLVGDGMNQLILCRAVQGLGAGALTTGAFAIVADIAPPAERGKYTGLFGAMFGLAGLAGPVLGGFLTDHATTIVMGHVVSGWRFIFYVNLPLGALALYILLTKLPHGQRGADAAHRLAGQRADRRQLGAAAAGAELGRAGRWLGPAARAGRAWPGGGGADRLHPGVARQELGGGAARSVCDSSGGARQYRAVPGQSWLHRRADVPAAVSATGARLHGERERRGACCRNCSAS